MSVGKTHSLHPMRNGEPLFPHENEAVSARCAGTVQPFLRAALFYARMESSLGVLKPQGLPDRRKADGGGRALGAQVIT